MVVVLLEQQKSLLSHSSALMRNNNFIFPCSLKAVAIRRGEGKQQILVPGSCLFSFVSFISATFTWVAMQIGRIVRICKQSNCQDWFWLYCKVESAPWYVCLVQTPAEPKSEQSLVKEFFEGIKPPFLFKGLRQNSVATETVDLKTSTKIPAR